MFGVLFAIFVVLICLNYMFLDIKVDKIKKDSLNKDQVIASLIAHTKALCKLNTGFKDHERRIENIEERLSYIEKHLLSEKCEKPEEPKKPKYTCKDCTYYHALSGIGFANAINFGFSNGINGFKCEKIGCSYPSDCNGICQLFEKKDGLDEDENVVYANNVKIDISSKGPRVYKSDGLLPEEYIDLISKLHYCD